MATDVKQQVIIDGTMSGTIVPELEDHPDGVLVDVGFGFAYMVARDRIALVA